MATSLWLEHEYMMSPASSKDPDKMPYLINIKEGAIPTPEQPEALAILRRLRRFNTMWWPGGYADQPHIQLMESNLVIECELEQESIRIMNALLSQPPPLGKPD